MAMRSLTFLLLLFHIKLLSVFGYPSGSDIDVEPSSTELYYIPISSDSKTGYIGHDAVIPCRPISPEIIVMLYARKAVLKGYERVDQNNRTSFDANFGFKIEHIIRSDQQLYKCKFGTKTNGEAQFFTLFLIVHEPPVVKIVNPPDHVIEGDDINFECDIRTIHDQTNFLIQWQDSKGPVQNSQNFASGKYSISTNVFKGVGHSVFKIKNITFEDAGRYKCQFKSWDLHLQATTTVHVHANQLSSVRITNEPHYDGKIFEKLGTNIELSATIKTTLNTLEGMKVEWMHNSRCVIISNAQHQITYTNNSTTLLIRNFSDSDVGSYTVRVHNYQKTKLLGSDSAYLQVWG